MYSSISVLIVNYNGEGYISDTISSCKDALSNLDEFEILILDNNSSDKSCDEINEYLSSSPDSRVKFISSSENHGFAKGCNILAENAKHDILFFLNNDTFVHSLNNLVGFLKGSNFDDSTVVALKTLNRDGTRQNNIFQYPTNLKLMLELLLLKHVIINIRDRLQSKSALSNDVIVQESSYFSGCALLVSKNTFMNVSKFDESFYFYHEECDLFLRMQKYFDGKLSKILIDDKITHFGGGGGIISEYSYVAYYTNLFRLFLKHKKLSRTQLFVAFKASYAIRFILCKLKIRYPYSPFSSTYIAKGTDRTCNEVLKLENTVLDNINREFVK